MPVYQYHCLNCDSDFDHVESMREHEDAHPRCPRCGDERVEQRFSAFFAKTSKKS
ncbi:MAG: zinc ribbon domain-containing protein [Gemmatimonadetes bacterium]|nr:zinc ribbon domain-containing protein [Gemmatimonadota bacterium]